VVMRTWCSSGFNESLTRDTQNHKRVGAGCWTGNAALASTECLSADLVPACPAHPDISGLIDHRREVGDVA
jgi:hypothetical protein